MAQWLGPSGFTTSAQVQSLVGADLKKKKKHNVRVVSCFIWGKHEDYGPGNSI